MHPPTSCRISVPGVPVRETQPPSDKKVVPQADPPSAEDVNHLYQLIDQSTKVVVLSGAGISTECGIPDYGWFYLLFALFSIGPIMLLNLFVLAIAVFEEI
ncbi:hypothetical protein GOBAR_AA40392 [Gossypium barbadense]|uniref:Uncharacterized protein n=1 Tax=Gossypium barbadense TaxID=3634 RepID=A0A2P5VNC4_GOSBA|nr:hypothetical protein GOBAR_AA40392 [Gossypium barbadense]